MKRVLLLTVLLAILLWGSSGSRSTGFASLAIEGGADGVGAEVYVNGRSLGLMTATRGGGAQGSRLEARVPLRRWNEFVIVSTRGVRLVSRAPLGESTLVRVSFRERWLTMVPLGAEATQAEADTLVGYDD